MKIFVPFISRPQNFGIAYILLHNKTSHKRNQFYNKKSILNRENELANETNHCSTIS